MYKKILCTALALPLLLTGCETGPLDSNGTTQVAVKFGMSAPGAAGGGSSVLSSAASAGGLVLEGTNGTLTITDISFIIAELELEAHEGACEGLSSAGCADFEAPPSFVRLPLATGGAFDVTSVAIPAGTYSELEFEVENLEVDEDDDQTKRQQVTNLLASIRQIYADFPERASMVVEGDFNGTPFRVYFDAEIEVEMDLLPALTISGEGASRTLIVDVQPALWFRNADGTVMDLSQFDYASTGRLVQFELEMEKGFVKVEFDD